MGDFNRGEVFIVEAELKEYTPFDDHAYANADSIPKITINDSKNNVRVDNQDMSNSATGKYYYTIESLTSWLVGNYDVIIVSIYNSKSNTYVKHGAFTLD